MNHVIMPNEIIKHLNVKPNGLYIDCTFGLGFHTNEILKYLNSNGKIITTDKEINSYFLSKKKYSKNKKIHSFLISFEKIDIILNKFKNKINGIIIDLGLSIYQFKSSKKGFGLNKNNFLDMRIDINEKIRVIDWINIATKKELEDIFLFFNNKNITNRFIKQIIANRKKNKIKTVQDLLNIFKTSEKNKEKNITNKIFLFIKIFINNDFLLIKNFLEKCFNLLKKNGKLIIISFNSSEDIIIKNILINLKYKTLLFKPTISDLNNNYASRSACMRIIIKNN